MAERNPPPGWRHLRGIDDDGCEYESVKVTRPGLSSMNGLTLDEAWAMHRGEGAKLDLRCGTINCDDEDVTSVGAALADAVHAGGLSSAYYRSADDALARIAARLQAPGEAAPS